MIFVPPLVTDDAAGAAELVTVVLLFSVWAKDLLPVKKRLVMDVMTVALRNSFMAQKLWLKLLEKAVSWL